MKRFSMVLMASILVFSTVIPVFASGLTLDITSVAMSEMEKEGNVWHVKPGTYQGF